MTHSQNATKTLRPTGPAATLPGRPSAVDASITTAEPRSTTIVVSAAANCSRDADLHHSCQLEFDQAQSSKSHHHDRPQPNYPH